MKLKPTVEKQNPIVYDNVNNNGLKISEPCQNQKFVTKKSAVSFTTNFEAYELSDTDINHNDIGPSSMSTNCAMFNPAKPATQTSSYSCSWWLLFLVNPSRQRQKPQQKGDSDISSNESVSHITFTCDHIKNVSSNMRHPYILKTGQTISAISAANYQFSLSSSKTSTIMCCNEKLNLSVLESDQAARIGTYCDKHFAAQEHERKCEDNKSKLFFATKSFSKCVGSVPRNKHQVMKFTKKKVLNRIIYLLSACFWIVMFFLAIKTWSRNQDWNTRKTLFR